MYCSYKKVYLLKTLLKLRPTSSFNSVLNLLGTYLHKRKRKANVMDSIASSMVRYYTCLFYDFLLYFYYIYEKVGNKNIKTFFWFCHKNLLRTMFICVFLILLGLYLNIYTSSYFSISDTWLIRFTL